MQTPFNLTINLKTPFVGSISTTLDAILCAAIYNRDGIMDERANDLIPIAFSHGIAKASMMILPPNYKMTTTSRKRLLMKNDLSPSFYQPDAKKGLFKGQYVYCSGDKGDKGHYFPKMSDFQAIQAEKLEFYAVGDPYETENLIKYYLMGIGKKHTSGQGEIESVFWTETDQDYSWVLPNGSPARQLPVDIWNRVSKEDAPTTSMSIRYPYWSTPEHVCVYPT